MAALAAARDGNEFFKIFFAFKRFPFTSLVISFSPSESLSCPAPIQK